MVKTPAKKKHRFFTAHELHISLMFIILTSFFSAVAFTYLIKVFGDTVREHSMTSFAVVMLGYAAVVWLLTITFTHRFIGPFERLRYEVGMVIAGDFKKRLKIRRQDDAYIRAFEDDVNRVIEVLEKDDRRSADMQRDLYSDLTKIINKMPAANPRRRELASLQDKVSAHLR
jgi:hypothetical protein